MSGYLWGSQSSQSLPSFEAHLHNSASVRNCFILVANCFCSSTAFSTRLWPPTEQGLLYTPLCSPEPPCIPRGNLQPRCPLAVPTLTLSPSSPPPPGTVPAFGFLQLGGSIALAGSPRQTWTILPPEIHRAYPLTSLSGLCSKMTFSKRPSLLTPSQNHSPGHLDGSVGEASDSGFWLRS